MKVKYIVTSKIEKLNRYQFIMKRLNDAIEQSFEIQAIAYEYALIEDRFNSILKYLDIQLKTNKVKDKIKVIRQIENETIKNLLPVSLLEQILSFIDARNQIMHGLAMITLEPTFITSVAKQGRELIKKLNQNSIKIKKNVQKDIKIPYKILK
jgi:polyhydroxyalkanoate synthesis regulator protein